jgi:hypothetical protein
MPRCDFFMAKNQKMLKGEIKNVGKEISSPVFG